MEKNTCLPLELTVNKPGIKSDEMKLAEYVISSTPTVKYNYVCWMVNNDSHRFVYDRDTRQFSEIKYGRTVGQYTFEEFDQLVKDRGMVSEFSPYEFKMEKE